MLAVTLLVLGLQGSITLKHCSAHPMQYYVSLPKGWTAGKPWPVVVAIESADRDFKKNAEDFVSARGDLPFIVVVPEVITGGGPRYREAPGYTYSAADWARIEKDGGWRFDEDGLGAVIADVHREYGGETKHYLTGWEAGTHTVFAMAFNHPERLAAVAAACPNYQGRYVSFGPSGAGLPFAILAGENDPMWKPGKPLYDQAQNAISDGKKHGFTFETITIAGAGHGPLALNVLSWFASVRKS